MCRSGFFSTYYLVCAVEREAVLYKRSAATKLLHKRKAPSRSYLTPISFPIYKNLTFGPSSPMGVETLILRDKADKFSAFQHYVPQSTEVVHYRT